jgi:flagellar basal body-associated protein FliL
MADEKKGAAPAALAGGDGGEGKKNGNLFLVLAIVLGIVLVETAAVYYIAPKPPKSDEEIAHKAMEDSLKLASEAATRMGAVTDPPIEVVVNISGEPDRFLKAAIIFEYDEKNVKLGEDLAKKMPKYKDMFHNHMSSLSLAEISDPTERDKIRKDLLRMINASLPAKLGEIQDVLFTTYIIQ